MAMVTLAVTTEARSAELGSLRDWLRQDDALRGAVEEIYQPPESGHLGPVLDVLKVVAETAPAAFAAALVAWLRSRRGPVKISIKTETGAELEFSADSVKTMTAADARHLIEQVT